MLTILSAGRLSSVQDMGRRGLRHLGIATSGAMDELALSVGNLMVGNAAGAPGIEITLGPVRIRFEQPGRIALTGADWNATLDGRPVHAWWAYPVAAGQVLELRSPRAGARGYLALAGAIKVPSMLGSCSTDLGAAFGGGFGRTLQDGDTLETGAVDADVLALPPLGVKSPALCTRLRAPLEARVQPGSRDDVLTVRVLPGAEYEQFSAETRAAFWQQHWTLTPNSNRMGYRLQGRAMAREQAHDLLSHAVIPGTIQVPPDGQPIVLMRDAQTTGGYPRLGAVIGADLWRLAQARLNAPLRFVEVDADQAREALAEVDRYLQQVTRALAEPAAHRVAA